MNDTRASDRRLPPMGGLAIMALLLAEQRGAAAFPEQDLRGFYSVHRRAPAQRSVIDEREWHPISWEYYQIIDCITYGHLWSAEKEFASCGRCHRVKAMRDFKRGEYVRGY